MYTPALRWDILQETHGPPPPNHPTLISADLCGSVFHRSNHSGGENTGDNLQETHGPPPPNHSTLISADLYGNGFHRINALHVVYWQWLAMS